MIDSSSVEGESHSISRICTSDSTMLSTSIPSQESLISISPRLKISVHIEAEIKRKCSLKVLDVNARVIDSLSSDCSIFRNGEMIVPATLIDIVDSIVVSDLSSNQVVSFWQAELLIHSFRLSSEEPESEYLEGDGGDLPLGEQLELPSAHLKGLWESIIVDEKIKAMLLNYCSTSLLFAGNNVDANLISWNKMILLHGPPGTGKTSLCKALAQKISIRNAHLFQSGILFEVNCHSLFSKWFSESGKLVMKLFQHINDIAEDDSCLVVLLIDEVESIAAARNNANRSGEPGDAIRVVNAVLTSLDQLRRRKNVLVMCTSNMQSALDEAFLDRLDLNIHIGNPSILARLEILSSCIQELLYRNLIIDTKSATGDSHASKDLDQRQSLLHQIAESTDGQSGRALRKLPIKAFSRIVGQSKVSVEEFLGILLETTSTLGAR